ncbi:MAG: SCO1664 family protein [Candidatus Limnocylindrales bacterium]
MSQSPQPSPRPRRRPRQPGPAVVGDPRTRPGGGPDRSEAGAAADAGGAPPCVELERDAILGLLAGGRLEPVGRLVDASNGTLFCQLEADGGADLGTLRTACVYKPIRGEAPLSDFPDGTLAYREVAAYVVSEAMGWSVVPPTVMRDGPFGSGMVQLWIEIDPAVDLFELARSDHPALRRMALFDAVVNNADRKGGHLLPIPGGHVHGVDHGVCFAVEPKLRTILWGWRGVPLADDECTTLSRLRLDLEGELGERLAELLATAEVRATCRRVDRLLRSRRFPLPDPLRPAIPWPPF